MKNEQDDGACVPNEDGEDYDAQQEDMPNWDNEHEPEA